MKTFKQHINEKWIMSVSYNDVIAKKYGQAYKKDDILDILKNPTLKEAKPLGDNDLFVRLIITNMGKGDVYVFPIKLLHDIAIEQLKTKKITINKSSSLLWGAYLKTSKYKELGLEVGGDIHADEAESIIDDVQDDLRKNKNLTRLFGTQDYNIPFEGMFR